MSGTRKRPGRGADTARQVRLALLAQVPQLSSCSRSELERIDALATEVRRPAGVVLHHAKHAVRQVVVVLEGDLLESNHGVAAIRGRCHLVGEEALRGLGSPAVTSVATASPVRALVLGLREVAEVAALPGVQARLAGRRARSVAAPAARRAWAGSAATFA